MQATTSSRVVDAKIAGGVYILLAFTDVAVRLTLEAVLEKSGYMVDSAASSAEAMEKIEEGQYSLVLGDLRGESASATREVIKLAQMQDYRPATAYLKASREANGLEQSDHFLVEPEDIPGLLTAVTELIANRAAGRSRRAVRRGTK